MDREFDKLPMRDRARVLVALTLLSWVVLAVFGAAVWRAFAK